MDLSYSPLSTSSWFNRAHEWLLKEKLRRMGSIAGLHSYYKWKDHRFTALQQLNNRALSTGGTPLSRMMTPNLQIRKVHTFPALHCWAAHPNAQAPYVGTTASAGRDLHNVEEIWPEPNTSQTVPTGIGIQTPKGSMVRSLPGPAWHGRESKSWLESLMQTMWDK